MNMLFFFFKQKTAYEMRISDWSSDVCSSDLFFLGDRQAVIGAELHRPAARPRRIEALRNQVPDEFGRLALRGTGGFAGNARRMTIACGVGLDQRRGRRRRPLRPRADALGIALRPRQFERSEKRT